MGIKEFFQEDIGLYEGKRKAAADARIDAAKKK